MNRSLLIVCTKLPWPLMAGDRLRIFNQAKTLKQAGWDIDLYACPWSQDNEELRKNLAELKQQGVFRSIEVRPQAGWRMKFRILRTFLTFLPAQVEFFSDPHLRHWIETHQHEYDTILFHHIRSIRPWLRGLKPSPSWILDLHDTISRNYRLAVSFKPIWLKYAYCWESWLLERAERRAVQRFSRIFLISKEEKETLSHRAHVNGKVLHLPLALPPSLFQRHYLNKADGPILFFGRLAYPPNADAARYLVREIMPLIWKKDPSRLCLIAGSEAPEKLLQDIKTDSRVQVILDVEDIHELAEKASLLLAPIRFGAGMQNKVLESLAIGLPILGTRVAVEEIRGTHGVHYLIGDTPEELSAQALRLLSDVNLRKTLSKNGRELVQREFSFEKWNQFFLTEVNKACHS